MTSRGRMVNVLYVAADGTVRAGRLVVEVGPDEGEGSTALVSRTGKALTPADIRFLLALAGTNEPRRAALLSAHRAGYRVEEA